MEHCVFNFLTSGSQVWTKCLFPEWCFSVSAKQTNHYFEFFQKHFICTIGKNKSKLKLFSTAGNDKYTDAWERFPVQATDDWDFQKDMSENECNKKLEGE